MCFNPNHIGIGVKYSLVILGRGFGWGQIEPCLCFLLEERNRVKLDMINMPERKLTQKNEKSISIRNICVKESVQKA